MFIQRMKEQAQHDAEVERQRLEERDADPRPVVEDPMTMAMRAELQHSADLSRQMRSRFR